MIYIKTPDETFKSLLLLEKIHDKHKKKRKKHVIVKPTAHSSFHSESKNNL